jgi:hypothetical protein
VPGNSGQGPYGPPRTFLAVVIGLSELLDPVEPPAPLDGVVEVGGTTLFTAPPTVDPTFLTGGADVTGLVAVLIGAVTLVTGGEDTTFLTGAVTGLVTLVTGSDESTLLTGAVTGLVTLVTGGDDSTFLTGAVTFPRV